MLVFKDAKVPWEKVIVHDNPALSRNIYVQTAAHVIANHQSNVRFGAKLRFMLGVASLVTRFTGARDIPAVRDTLGRLAALEAGFNAMIDGQIEAVSRSTTASSCSTAAIFTPPFIGRWRTNPS